MTSTQTSFMAAIAATVLAWPLHAYGQGGRGAAPPQPPKASAPIDITGYWVSVVTEDWRYRMVTPTKGDYQGVPINADARKVADSWDPEADTAVGQQCKSYGAPASLRIPGRVHITWQDDETLKVELDAGTQTRLFRFAPTSVESQPSWQGVSTAQWERPPAGRGGGGQTATTPKGGWLKITTTNLKAGFLRKNGVPYSEAARLTEYFDVGPLPGGGEVLMLTSIVDDPKYLTQPFVVSTQFKKQADASGWDPTPCSSTW